MSDHFVDIPITGFDPAFLSTCALESELIDLLAVTERASVHRRLQVLLAFNRRAIWLARGFASCAAWWAATAQIKLSTAHDHVRVARALRKFEPLDRALAEQTLSYAKIRCLVPHATASNVADLVTLAQRIPSGRLRATVVAFRSALMTCDQMQSISSANSPTTRSTNAALAARLTACHMLTYSCAQPIVNHMVGNKITSSEVEACSAARTILDQALESLNADELNQLREMLDQELGIEQGSQFDSERGRSDIEFFQHTWGLNQSEAADLFGISRQAYSKWLAGGPPNSKVVVFADLAASSEVLVRHLQPSRIPAVVRRPAPALGGSSLIDLVASGQSGQVLAACRAMFAFKHVQQ